MGNLWKPKLDKQTVNEFIDKYKNHPSISKIDGIHKSTDLFIFRKSRKAEIS